MGGKEKHHRWKIYIYRSASSSSPKSPQRTDPPKEFLCPLSGLLMFDPVVVSSGQTFDRTSLDICKDLSFTPSLSDNSIPNFSTIIPNLALKTTILNWCKKSHVQPPLPPDYSSIKPTIQNLMSKASEKELLKGVSENHPVLFSHAASELTSKNRHLYSPSSSSEESVIANTTPSFIPFTTRPTCYSSSSSGPSTSSEIIYDETLIGSLSVSSGEDEALVMKMKSLDVYEQEQAVILLRKTTRNDEESRISLCSLKLLQALKPLLMSRYAAVQTNAAAGLVNLSLDMSNKVKIVRSGMVPILIDLMKNGFEESQEHAAGAIFSLSLEDENKMAIGVLGALQPLLHSLRSGTERTRHDSAFALYHLTLVESNGTKLIKLGAIGVLLGMLKGGDLVGRVVLVVCNLAVCEEGRSALLDGNGVECLVALLRGGGGEFDSSESTRENAVAALYSLSNGSMRFKVLAREARAVEALQVVVESGSERAKEKAKRILVMLREGGEEVDGEVVLKKHSVVDLGHQPLGPHSVNSGPSGPQPHI